MSHHLISLMILFPFLGALAQAFVPSPGASSGSSLGRWVALVASMAASICGIVLSASMQKNFPDLQFAETYPWITSYAINYEMAIDGLNVLMVLLVSIIFPVIIASEWTRKSGVRGMMALFLLLQSTLAGAVCAQDLFIQFFFWSFAAIPIYFLIGIWGNEGREAAAFRTVMAAAIGNALFFAALLLIYYAVDPHSFSLHELGGGRLAGKSFEILGYECSVSFASFLLISLGLALRAGVWPIHGWLLQAAQEGPASAFVTLAGVTLPVACYLFIRNCYTLFPEIFATVGPSLVWIGAINLLVGGVCAIAQRSARPLIAYTSLSQGGLLLIGIGSMSPSGVVGTVYQQVSLGLGLAGFGLLSGLFRDRTGKDEFLGTQRELSGIVGQAPAVAVVAAVVLASILGVPGFGGFVGQSLVIIGSYSVHPITIILWAVAMLLATYYLLTMYRAVFFGKLGEASSSFADLNWREKAYFLPLAAGLLVLGLYPKPFLDLVRPTVHTLLSSLTR